MKMAEAVKCVGKYHAVNKYLNSLDKNEILTNVEIETKTGVSSDNARHILERKYKNGEVFKISVTGKIFYALDRGVAQKFADIVGGKIDN